MRRSPKPKKPPPKKRKDQRKKGNVFKSNDVNAVASLFIIFMILKIYLPITISYLKVMIISAIETVGEISSVGAAECINLISKGFIYFAICCAPIVIVGGLVNIIATGVQTKFLVASELIKFKLNKLNPIEGIKKMFSLKSIFELLKASIKIAVIGIVVYQSFKGLVPFFPNYMDMSIGRACALALKDVFNIVIRVAAVFLFVAAADYGYNWWEYEKKMRMGKQELKEEFKQTEGDPQVKGKIREKQRAAAMNRMMQQVPQADVVIRNPTHVAVALKYEPEKGEAPIVVAKGIDNIALKIVEIAEENGVYTTENVALARAIYKSVDIDMPIPSEFYVAVAEILAFVYKLKNKKID